MDQKLIALLELLTSQVESIASEVNTISAYLSSQSDGSVFFSDMERTKRRLEAIREELQSLRVEEEQ